MKSNYISANSYLKQIRESRIDLTQLGKNICGELFLSAYSHVKNGGVFK